jgi:hypothetical protein
MRMSMRVIIMRTMRRMRIKMLSKAPQRQRIVKTGKAKGQDHVLNTLRSGALRRKAEANQRLVATRAVAPKAKGKKGKQ